MPDGRSDIALWRGLLARDPHALEAVIARYSREVAYFVRVVLAGVGTEDDIARCVGDVFVVAWEEADSFDPAQGAFRVWLTLRAKCVALDCRRHLLRQMAAARLDRADRSEWSRPSEGDGQSGLAASRMEECRARAERRERQMGFRRALEELPEIDRLMLYLRYFRQTSADEISARTGMTRRAVNLRLWRARKSLREALETIEEQVHGRVRAL